MLKILSPDIAHKSEVGGVALDPAGRQGRRRCLCSDDGHCRRARAQRRNRGRAGRADARGGVELLVGIARDPQWGLVCALGLGGFWVEALADTALCLLPASHDEIVAAFRSLRGVRMLEGYRGTPVADLDAVADAVHRASARQRWRWATIWRRWK